MTGIFNEAVCLLRIPVFGRRKYSSTFPGCPENCARYNQGFELTQSPKTITVADPRSAIEQWFSLLSQYCSSVDYESARAIFAPDVVAFGTRMDVVSGLDILQRNQWEGIWPNIQDFNVDPDSVHAGGGDTHAWGVATWTSTGFDEEGNSYFRPGRATIALERREGIWLAVHTHFSLYPGTPPRTFGPRS